MPNWWKLAPVAMAFAILQAGLRRKDEAKLARRLRDRDPRVMAALYERYGKLVYSIILRVVRDSATAENLVQETFLRIWNRASGFDPERGSLGPWIATLARNRAIDHLRSSAAQMAGAQIGFEHLDSPAIFNGLEEHALTVDRARRLKHALRKLTDNQRTVIELAYFEGLSQAEMAERLKEPPGTVQVWTRSALKALREELGEAVLA